MKLKLKMVAAAAALASLAGGAHADLTGDSSQNNGSFSLLAYNTVNFNWYIRDLGYLMNDFLPTGITTKVADNNQGDPAGPNPAAVGNKSPDSGLIIAGSSSVAAATQTPGGPRPVEIQANFSDPTFGSWLSEQGSAEVKWMVGSYDLSASALRDSTKRMIVSSNTPDETFTNGMIDSFTSSGAWGGLWNFFNPGTLSKTGTLMNVAVAVNGFQSFNGQSLVGESANLYYATRTTYTGSSSTTADITPYGTAGGLATITLEADGDFIYDLPAAAVAAVPLPPALWMMGAGLAAIGGVVRRRSAALQA